MASYLHVMLFLLRIMSVILSVLMSTAGCCLAVIFLISRGSRRAIEPRRVTVDALTSEDAAPPPRRRRCAALLCR